MITESQLKQIIKEELEVTLKEYYLRGETPFIQVIRHGLIAASGAHGAPGVRVDQISQRDARELSRNIVKVGQETFKGALNDPALQESLGEIVKKMTRGKVYVSDQEAKEVEDVLSTGDRVAWMDLYEKLKKDPNIRGSFTRDPEGRSNDLIVMSAFKGTSARTAGVLFVVFKTIGDFYSLSVDGAENMGTGYYLAAVPSPGVAK